VIAVHRRTSPPPGPRPILLELTDAEALSRALDALRPDAVVHAAAIGRADLCQERPDEAERVNARLAGEVARLCHQRSLRLVALSTDLVFGGERAFAREEDAPGPLSLYGRTKLAGEDAVLAACPAAAVARVALVSGRGHGARGTSTESVAWALRAGRSVRLFTDEYRTPVDAESIADALARILDRGGSGRYHLGGPERLSRHELGLRVARALSLPESGLVAALQSEYPGGERRAPDVSLESTRARCELGWEPLPVDEAIRGGRPGPAPGA
jgi:dTDP-4-dehydrorhamnose reductase